MVNAVVEKKKKKLHNIADGELPFLCVRWFIESRGKINLRYNGISHCCVLFDIFFALPNKYIKWDVLISRENVVQIFIVLFRVGIYIYCFFFFLIIHKRESSLIFVGSKSQKDIIDGASFSRFKNTLLTSCEAAAAVSRSCLGPLSLSPRK